MGVELQAEDVQDVSVVLTQAQPSDPNQSLQPTNQPAPVKLDRDAVRAATMEAAKAGLDPFDMVVGDLSKPSTVEVPEKFKKPNGEVDVEKLKTSTERLDEAIEKKEQAVQVVQKSIDDYVKAYREKEAKLSSIPNPEKLQAKVAEVAPVAPAPVDMNVLRDRINQDFQRDPVGTMSDLVDILVNQRMGKVIEPLRGDLEQVKIDKQDRQLRANLQDLAEKDPRVLDPKVFSAITAKLDASPELWNLKNPHEFAWLKVKDELRLGDVPHGTSAQPSRSPSPILGGGTPPPAPSSSDGTAVSIDTLLKAAAQVGRDPRDVKYDPKQAANMRAAAKAVFDQLDRQARR